MPNTQWSTRGTWAVDVWNGSSYTTGATIYRPNANFQVGLSSSQMMVKLANGSKGYVNPEINYTRDTLTFQWVEIWNTDAFIAQLQGYITNANQLRITTHTGTQYIGQFISWQPIWLINETDTFDISANFERTLG